MARPSTAEADEDGPERTCVVTRRKAQPDSLIRFVLGPDGAVVPDLKRRLPGRGVWVSAEAQTLAQAVQRKAFARGLKTSATASPTLVAEVDALLERDALAALSLANKAGLVTVGFAKVESAIASTTLTALVHASDGGEDGLRKMRQGLTRRFGPVSGVPVIAVFTSSQLDLALGRSNVIHAALAPGNIAHIFVSRSQKLVHYRGAPAAGFLPDTIDGESADLDGEGASSASGTGLSPGIQDE